MRHRRLLQIGRNLLLVILLTWVLLEITVRIVWWHRDAVRILDKEIFLLPVPLVNEEQVQILKAWASNPQRYLQFDPVLGWSIRPGAQSNQDGVVYTSNSAGMRGPREYALQKPEGFTRIGTFGPSFTHGDEVGDAATWQAQLERARPDLEVMNWGVGGYGTDQAFLRYRLYGAAYKPDIVIIGFEEDNLRRNVNRFRPFFRGTTEIPLTKPVFIESNHALVLVENPFKTLESLEEALLYEPGRFLDTVCPHDFYCERERYQPRPGDSFNSIRFFRTLAYEVSGHNPLEISALQDPYVQAVNFLLLQQFVTEVSLNGGRPVVLVFPEQGTMEAHERGEQTAYDSGITLLRQQGLQVIDLASAFVHARASENRRYPDYYAHEGGHFNELGNYIVSQTVLAQLCQAGLLTGC